MILGIAIAVALVAGVLVFLIIKHLMSLESTAPQDAAPVEAQPGAEPETKP